MNFKEFSNVKIFTFIKVTYITRLKREKGVQAQARKEKKKIKKKKKRNPSRRRRRKRRE